MGNFTSALLRKFHPALTQAGLRRVVPIEGARVAVQGFGNVGGIAARLFEQAGARIVALQDHSATLVDEAGINVLAAGEHVGRTGPLEVFCRV
ncbi:Glu/Leu/Phe/Val dehydrogenase (plasmid) [Rhizobium grahamii CCGE 502]|uniref:Glu/Leu/Phe/Val dehydrogenase n=1 Tax=Rhizobium grahamii CCGE 502 TaxID=990285 RepID=S3HJW6_9HYPH|nr:Glu/Leu/Phe/Val dehydrogenase [Rhizobium grahamii CCGE 502]